MRRPETRHYAEEEMLLHVLGEETAEAGQAIAAHFDHCQECSAVCREYSELVRSIKRWEVPELPEESWKGRKLELLRLYREDGQHIRRKGLWDYLGRSAGRVWEYALANPLPALGYVVAAVAFASERTINLFHLDKVLPATTEVFKIIRQLL